MPRRVFRDLPKRLELPLDLFVLYPFMMIPLYQSVTMRVMILAPLIRRSVFALALASVLSPPARAQEDQVVYEVRSQFQLITVRDTANGYRQLIFDGRFDGTDAIQSEMNLANHEELTLSYARHIMTALPVAARIKRILIIGLGGASMQRYLHKLLPGTTIETAELDPEIQSVAAKFFFFKEDDRQIVHLGDGRTFLENSKAKYDIIFLDAFSALSIPYRLATQEFLKVVRDHLADGGMACANLWDGEADYYDMVKTYAVTFPEVHVVKCAYSGNTILLALPTKVDLTVKTWMAMAEVFEKTSPTGLDLAQLIARGAAEKLYIPETARILLDK
jgi:spermidine synthase